MFTEAETETCKRLIELALAEDSARSVTPARSLSS
jgi:hypothetical protein